MKNTRLENVIEQVKNERANACRSWIFNDNGTIKDNVITGEVLYLLEEMKKYEVKHFKYYSVIDTTKERQK